MMIKPVFAVRDCKVGFTDPFVDVNEESAIRGFRFGVDRAKDSIMYINRRDFSLYHIGQYDTASGRLTAFDVPKFICEAYEESKNAE